MSNYDFYNSNLCIPDMIEMYPERYRDGYYEHEDGHDLRISTVHIPSTHQPCTHYFCCVHKNFDVSPNSISRVHFFWNVLENQMKIIAEHSKGAGWLKDMAVTATIPFCPTEEEYFQYSLLQDIPCSLENIHKVCKLLQDALQHARRRDAEGRDGVVV